MKPDTCSPIRATFIIGSAARWLGWAMQAARQHWDTAANFKGDFQEMSVRAFSEMTYSQRSRGQSWQDLKAKRLFRDLLTYAQKLQRAGQD